MKMKTKFFGLALLSLLISSYMLTNSEEETIFNFNSNTSDSSWRILNDGVMGGVSKSSFKINKDGHGEFKGEVSTANNGGFASVRHNSLINTKNSPFIQIRLKGDGKKYQFRIKKNKTDFESYITTFQTSGTWETITIKLSDLYPSFRGRRLDKSNFEGSKFEEIVFLISNKKSESFKLILDKIELTDTI